MQLGDVLIRKKDSNALTSYNEAVQIVEAIILNNDLDGSSRAALNVKRGDVLSPEVTT
jgi:hypothetical protein